MLALSGLPAVPAMAERNVTISALCLSDGTEYRTLAYVTAEIARTAGRHRHDLVVVPLMPFLTFTEGREQEGLAPFVELARRHETYLAVALEERAHDGRHYQTALLFDRGGRVTGRYRKSHAVADDDKRFALGDELPVFRTDFGKIGLTLGTDFYFPEVYTVLQLKGAEIILWQHYPERLRDHSEWPSRLKARALDNKVHLVTAMYADPRPYLSNNWELGMQGAAWGRSMVLNRVGVPIADTGHDDGAATATVDLDRRKTVLAHDGGQNENVFYVQNLGGRAAFRPLAERMPPATLPQFEKRMARIAVVGISRDGRWRNSVFPDRILAMLDEAAKGRPDLVLFAEMQMKATTPLATAAIAAIGAKAREMKAYIVIGGVHWKDEPGSNAWLWNRQGELVFESPIYWSRGFPEFKTFDTDFARIGIHICGDLHLPEIDRILALKGAELILDPSLMWGPDGFTNTELLRARAADNGVWLAVAHWNWSDPGLRGMVVDPYGQVRAATEYMKDDVVFQDIDFERKKYYYAGRKPQQPKRGDRGVSAYHTGDLPDRREGWREMIFAHRRAELYGIITTENPDLPQAAAEADRHAP
jgi:predicted amidohydrolase